MIYENSRYTHTNVDVDDNVSTFKLRKRFTFNNEGAIIHQFRQGDRLDGLALKYYEDPQLWWVFLEANPQYRSELDIEYGTNLIVPSKEEVIKCLNY